MKGKLAYLYIFNLWVSYKFVRHMCLLWYDLKPIYDGKSPKSGLLFLSHLLSQSIEFFRIFSYHILCRMWGAMTKFKNCRSNFWRRIPGNGVDHTLYIRTKRNICPILDIFKKILIIFLLQYRSKRDKYYIWFRFIMSFNGQFFFHSL